VVYRSTHLALDIAYHPTADEFSALISGSASSRTPQASRSLFEIEVITAHQASDVRLSGHAPKPQYHHPPTTPSHCNIRAGHFQTHSATHPRSPSCLPLSPGRCRPIPRILTHSVPSSTSSTSPTHPGSFTTTFTTPQRSSHAIGPRLMGG
jgi:hypothetical protein